MEVEVTPEAAEYISERGGRLFLRQESVNADWATDQKAFDDPGARSADASGSGSY